jgi:sugar lactone lactonase YvrE
MLGGLRGVRISALAVALLSACAGGISAPSGIASNAALSGARSLEAAKSKPATLYVLDQEDGAGVVRIYKGRGTSYLRSVQPNSYGEPVSMAVDSAGSLYMSVYNRQAKQRGTLYVYGNRGSKLLRTLTQRSGFASLTLDEDGNLYSYCPGRHICEYPAGNEPISRKLSGIDAPLATDDSGDLVANRCGLVGAEACVFAPGQQTPYWSITSGLDNLYMKGFAFDPQGNLYAANQGDELPTNPGSIPVFAPTDSSPSRVIATGIAGPQAMVADAKGNLYVYNTCGGSYNSSHQCSTFLGAVTVYAPGASTPSRTITNGVTQPTNYAWGSLLAVDNAGYLYVANSFYYQHGIYHGPTVTVYKPGSNDPVRTITDVQAPVALAVGP